MDQKVVLVTMAAQGSRAVLHNSLAETSMAKPMMSTASNRSDSGPTLDFMIAPHSKPVS